MAMGYALRAAENFLAGLVNLCRALLKRLTARRMKIDKQMSVLPSGEVLFKDQYGEHIYLSDLNRVSQYPDGLKARLAKLQVEYSLTEDILRAGPVIDIGANVGELGIVCERLGSDYIGFEPDPMAYAALKRNVESENVYSIALSNYSGKAEFGLATASADSSLLIGQAPAVPTVTVRVARLDDLSSELNFPAAVGLLKVEAEGNEPEVLEGAISLLKTVKYCAVDAGPERNGQDTAPQVVEIMHDVGFRLVQTYLKRGTFLFRRY